MFGVLCRKRDLQPECARHPQRCVVAPAGRHSGCRTGRHLPATCVARAPPAQLLLRGAFGRFGRSDLPRVAVEHSHAHLATRVCSVMGVIHQHSHAHMPHARPGTHACFRIQLICVSMNSRISKSSLLSQHTLPIFSEQQHVHVFALILYGVNEAACMRKDLMTRCAVVAAR